MATVSIRDIRKTFGSQIILRGIDLEIADGEFLVLIGPSGCGKSTLLRLIAGLEEANSGEIAIGGQRMNERPPKDRDIAMVFQSYALYRQIMVAESLSFALRLRKTPEEEIRRRTVRPPKSSA